MCTKVNFAKLFLINVELIQSKVVDKSLTNLCHNFATWPFKKSNLFYDVFETGTKQCANILRALLLYLSEQCIEVRPIPHNYPGLIIYTL